jgi:hypothetical protein
MWRSETRCTPRSKGHEASWDLTAKDSAAAVKVPSSSAAATCKGAGLQARVQAVVASHVLIRRERSVRDRNSIARVI